MFTFTGFLALTAIYAVVSVVYDAINGQRPAPYKYGREIVTAIITYVLMLALMLVICAIGAIINVMWPTFGMTFTDILSMTFPIVNMLVLAMLASALLRWLIQVNLRLVPLDK